VPIAAEDYGDMSHTVKVVAAARKRDLYMTLFNLKSKNSPLLALICNVNHVNNVWSFEC
jgi:hypothetical protein